MKASCLQCGYRVSIGMLKWRRCLPSLTMLAGHGREADVARLRRRRCLTRLGLHVWQEREAGVAALELAMAVPLLILLCAFGLDFATYFGYTAKVDTMASVACRYVMDHSGDTPTTSSLKSALSTQFPELDDEGNSFDVRIEARGSATEELSYPIYMEDKLQSLSTNIGTKTYCVTISTTQLWPALGFAFAGSDGKFSVRSQRLCEVDRLQDSKWVQK